MPREWRRLRELAFPDDGWLYRDAHYLVAEVPIGRPDVAASWVPRPLRLASRVATVFTAYFPHTTFGSVYREAGLLLHVRHRCRRALFSPWMVVDDDVAMILGRELLGYPKKMARVEWASDAAGVVARADRHGEAILEMRASLGPPSPDPPPILGRPHRNVRSSLGLALPWIVAFTLEEVPIEVRQASLELVIHRNERDPLHALELHPVQDARLHRVNLRRGRGPWPVGIASPLAHARHTLRRVL